jgi:hypothetical protein
VPIEANLPATAARLANNEIREPAPENKNLQKSVVTALGLGLMALVGHKIQTSGLTYEIPDYPRLVTDSIKHPFVGYIGAAVGHLATRLAARRSGREISQRETVGNMLAGATIANFGAEQSQSMLYAINEYKDYFSAKQTPETIKDYFFALGGLWLYKLQSLPRQKKQLSS